MKTLIAASLLLALIVPAHASKFRESDRKNLPLMDKLGDAASFCLRDNYDDERHGKVCEEMQRLIAKLYRRGYCYIAYGAVGRPGKRYVVPSRTEDGKDYLAVRRHCYTIDFPEPEPVMKHFKTPYQQGMRDWREGLCFRARPYLDNSLEQERWRLGYHAGAKKYPKRDMAHCHLGSIKGLN